MYVQLGLDIFFYYFCAIVISRRRIKRVSHKNLDSQTRAKVQKWDCFLVWRWDNEDGIESLSEAMRDLETGGNSMDANGREV